MKPKEKKYIKLCNFLNWMVKDIVERKMRDWEKSFSAYEKQRANIPNIKRMFSIF